MEKSPNNEPAVSVIMSVYNGHEHLSRAIESILSQTFRDFEFLIVDDGSTDDSFDIITSHSRKDPRIKVLRNEVNIGLTRSLNKALTAVRRQYIARQDSDDISLPERLKRQFDFLTTHPEVCLVGCSAIIIDSSGREIRPRPYNLAPSGIRNFMRRHNLLTHGSVMFRRGEILALGGYREQFHYAQDYDLWLRIMERYYIHILPEYLYKTRISLENISMSRAILQDEYASIARRFHRERIRRGTDSYDAFFKTFKPDNIPTSGPKAKARYHFLKAMYLLGEDMITDMRKELLASLKYYPSSIRSYFYIMISLVGRGGINVLRRVRDFIYTYF